MDEIIAKLNEYIRERCEVGDDPEYGLDVIMFAEEAFGVKISQRDVTLYPMNTVNEIAEVVGMKKGLC